MSTITGPKIQVPVWAAEIFPDRPDVQSFLHSLQNTTFNVSRSGPTASRPTKALDGRFISMPYFDTTLGLTVYLKSTSPDVWVNGTGTPV